MQKIESCDCKKCALLDEEDREPAKEELLKLERDYSKGFVDWRKGRDNMYTFFKRAGMDTLAEDFARNYKHHKMPLNKSHV